MAVGQARRFVSRELSDVQGVLAGTLAKLARRRLLRLGNLLTCRRRQQEGGDGNARGGGGSD